LVAVVGEIVVVGLADAEVGPVDIVDLQQIKVESIAAGTSETAAASDARSAVGADQSDNGHVGDAALSALALIACRIGVAVVVVELAILVLALTGFAVAEGISGVVLVVVVEAVGLAEGQGEVYEALVGLVGPAVAETARLVEEVGVGGSDALLGLVGLRWRAEQETGPCS
jgi:hypothetical protein